MRTGALTIVDWGFLEYATAHERQKSAVAERIDDRAEDRLFFVEHPPTITVGRSGNDSDLCLSESAAAEKGIRIVSIERGGRATFHGPGQMIAYPVIKLIERDLHRYMERLLTAAAAVLAEFGLVPERKPGRPGIWVNGGKIASVGIAVKKWVTYHGLALNIDTDLSFFQLIVPCGRPDERITSVNVEVGITVSPADVKARFADAFKREFGYAPKTAFKRRHPPWLVLPPENRGAVAEMEGRLARQRLATVCQSARCPNRGECFGQGTATFMILGSRCTRRCRFCAVEKGFWGKGRPEVQSNRKDPAGDHPGKQIFVRPADISKNGPAPQSPGVFHPVNAVEPVDPEEPRRVAETAAALGLTHVVVTSVTRDDIEDGGAEHFAKTVRAIRNACPDAAVEVLVPDFNADSAALETVFAAGPDVFNHNVETVPRLYSQIRPGADYRRSLAVLAAAAEAGLFTKSGLMVGLGETESEIFEVLRDLNSVGCRSVTIGQYLAPSREHAPVVRYIPPAEFRRYAEAAAEMGFDAVAAAPLVRSSYRAKEFFPPSFTEVRKAAVEPHPGAIHTPES
jgi:lipoic acid synthetase